MVAPQKSIGGRVSAKTRLRRGTPALTPGTSVPSRAECPGFVGEGALPLWREGGGREGETRGRTAPAAFARR